MFPRKAKNNRLPALALCLITWLAVGVLYSFSAEAQGVVLIHPQNNEICPITVYDASNYDAQRANRMMYGIVKRMVYCVQGLVIPAAYQIMYAFSVYYIYLPVGAACTLAVIIWGFMMVTGKAGAPMREAFLVALKVGLVMMFTYVLGASDIWPYGLFPIMIDIVDELSSIVSNYIGYSSSMGCAVGLSTADIWGRVDAAINALVGGIFNPTLLMAGLSGFLVSALVSGTFGMFIAIVGFYIIFILIMAILRAAYVTITAYVAIALMAIVSPIFITMILFKPTFAYFEKWLKLTIGFMLQPLFLFAYLAMMLAAFDTVVYDGPFSIYRSLVPARAIGSFPMPLPAYPAPSYGRNPCGDFLIGNWLFDTGVYRNASAGAMGVSTNPRLDAHVEARNIGIGGNTGVKELPASAFNRRDAGGILLNVLDNFAPANVFKVDIPVKKIAWQHLALIYANQTGAGLTQEQIDNIRLDYLIQVFLSLMLALLTMYIFYELLDRLPFIGSGMGGDKHSMPTFGAKGMKMPGNKILDKMKTGMGKLAGGGG